MHFKTKDEGYLFTQKRDLSLGSNIFVYKTTDGGKNWEQIYHQNGYKLFGPSILYKGAIFGTVTEQEDLRKSNLFKLDLATHAFSLLDINTIGVDYVGDYILAMDGNISSFFRKDEQYGFLTTDMNFSSVSLKPFDYVIYDRNIINDNTNIYFITYENQLIIQTDGKYRAVEIKDPVCITKIAEKEVLIATNKHDSIINLYKFDARNFKLEKLHTIENYSIIYYLQANEKVIVGFVGNIKGFFVEYDLIYSTDKGQTWQIQTLEEIKIKPNRLVDNILYIYSGIESLEKFTF